MQPKDKPSFELEDEDSQQTGSGGRTALFAVVIALVLGAAFYGLNKANVATAPATVQQK